MTEVVITWEWLVFVDNVDDRTHLELHHDSRKFIKLSQVLDTTPLVILLHALHAIDGAT